jgi:alpha-D-ribose 1-methylphosphonate 5-triphosphate synthase subunit PhnG
MNPADSGEARRQRWLSVLARARPRDLERSWQEFGATPAGTWLRRPETGLVMVRGRAGGDGAPFNLGEMSVTRCALRTADGRVGVGYVQGRDHAHAARVAMADALLQDPAAHGEVMARVVEPLARLQAQRRDEARRKAAATRVEFLTLVRGEDGE